MKTIPVLFNPKQQAASNESYSPSAQKPMRVVRRWKNEALAIEIKDFEPASIDLLSKVHDPDYVQGVFALKRYNGFNNTSKDVADSLVWTTGSMVAAAREALSNGKVACSPTSGFHHAHYRKGCKYCTFNGLIVAAVDLMDTGFTEKVSILDLDAHYADGTKDILKHFPDLEKKVNHYNFGGDVKNYTPSGIREWMVELPGIVAGMAANSGIILYQAGADPHNFDPLGGYMSSEQMRERDRIVFSEAAKANVPVAWNLAGGYQEPFERVLNLHSSTMQACMEVYIQDE